MKNNLKYKWSKIFASKRYNSKDGTIKLSVTEQQELLDNILSINKPANNCPICQSKDLFSFDLTHYKCRECNSQFTN